MDGLQLGQVCINGFADIIKSVETKKGLSDQCGRIKVRKRRFQDLLQCFSQQYQIPISRFTYPIELVLVDITSIEENLPGFDSGSLLHAKLGRRIFTFAVASTTINVRIRGGSRHPLVLNVVIDSVGTNIGSSALFYL